MKKLLYIFILVFFSIGLKAQDTIRIKHLNYTTVFSKSMKYPVLVEWWETKAKNCSNPLPRKDQFQKDPLLPIETDLIKDYVGSGTDKGHMCPAASNECLGAQVLTECFYFSNMAPQYHNLNAGDWEKIEKLTRQLAVKNDSVFVWAGSLGVAKKFNRLIIPLQCWKVVYCKKTGIKTAYLFNNTNDNSKNRIQNVSVSQIEKLTNFKF